MRKAFKAVAVATMASGILTMGARADDFFAKPDGEEDSSSLTVGVLAQAGQSALLGKENILPFPILFYENKFLTVETATIYLHPLEMGPFRLSAVGSVRVSDIEFSSDDRLDAFDRDIAFEAGGQLSFTLRDFTLYGQFLKDVTDAHDGEEYKIGLRWERRMGRVSLMAEGAAVHRSSELMTFLYGVGPGDAASGFAAYTPDAGWSGTANLFASYAFANNWAVISSISGERLTGSAFDSPIVSKRNTVRFGLGLSYTF